MKFLIAAAFAVTVAFYFAMPVAQEPASEEGSDREAAPDIVQLVKDVNAVADSLTANIAEMQAAITAAADSREEAAELLDRVQVSLEAVHAGLAEDGSIWAELSRALAVWDENRRAALEKSESNPAFDAIAEGWAGRIDQAAALREQILAQRAENTALLSRIVSGKELMLAYYDLGQADKALEAMQEVSDDLGRMNDSMHAIVDQMTVVAGPAIAQ